MSKEYVIVLCFLSLFSGWLIAKIFGGDESHDTELTFLVILVAIVFIIISIIQFASSGTAS